MHPANSILIVDDNPTNLAVIAQVLYGAGYMTRVAMDGAAAIAQVKNNPPDLILLDIQMPVINGFEACKQLKSDHSTAHIPIIFITASDSVASKVKGLSLGAVDYITKPFQNEEVLARVKVHLQLRNLTNKVQEQAIALKKANLELQRLANLDGLTKVANRRCFDNHLQKEWLRHSRAKNYLSLILGDIDYFKDFNDCFGHQDGDTCLYAVAQAIQAVLNRPDDLVARYGGEEFAIILPNTHPQGALQVAELIRRTISTLEITHKSSNLTSHITMSLGVSSLIPKPSTSFDSLISQADQSLYIAKRNGRDQSHQVREAIDINEGQLI